MSQASMSLRVPVTLIITKLNCKQDRKDTERNELHTQYPLSRETETAHLSYDSLGKNKHLSS